MDEIENKPQFDIPNISIPLYDTLAFAEWIDINCVRNGEHKWTYRGDNFRKNHSTEDMYQIYKLS